MSKIHYGRGYVYSIQYYLVWCIKYRHDVLIGQVDGDLKRVLKQIAMDNVSWSSFVTKLQYKAEWYGRKIIKVDRWFPSTQICSECDHRGNKMSLDIREWTCPICHTHHDRDINASRNILNEGLRTHALA